MASLFFYGTKGKKLTFRDGDTIIFFGKNRRLTADLECLFKERLGKNGPEQSI